MKWITARRRHPLAGYVVVTLALALFGLGYAFVAPETDRAQAQEFAAEAENDDQVDIAQGRQIFTESCASCHGLDGKGTGQENIPDITGSGGAAIDFQVSTGRMPSMDPNAQMPRKPPVFTQEQIDDLVAYYEEEIGAAEPAVPEGVPGNMPRRAEYEDEESYEEAKAEYEEAVGAYVQGADDTAAGEKLYLTNCAHCHGWSGGGGALTGGNFAPDLREASPRQFYEAMVTGPGAMPYFNDETITPDEKQDLIAHFLTLESESNAGGIFALNRVGQVAEGFIGWTVGLSLIVACAIWITAKQRAHD